MSIIKQMIPRGIKSFPPSAAEVDWQYVETLVHGPGAWDSKEDTNSAVFACLMAIATSYPEPPLVVKRTIRPGTDEVVDNSPLQQLLEKPTPKGEMNMNELLFWTAWAQHVDGNAYWLKVRSGDSERGNVVQLWPVSPVLMHPVTKRDGSGRALDWISNYEQQVSPGVWEDVPIENVIHFRLGIDPKDMRKGLSPLKAAMRQVATDEEATKFTEALLQNYAVPGLVVIPSEGTMLDETDADRIENKLRRKYGSDNRGNIAVMSQSSKVEQFGFSPEELNLKDLHRLPEERISAVFGVAAIVAGLGAGLDQATYSNARTLLEMFTERKLIPMWRADATKLNISLKPDFTSDPDVFIEFDISDVRALQEDENEKYTRIFTATGNIGWMTIDEARSETGLDPLGGDQMQMQPEQAQNSTSDNQDEEAQATEEVLNKALVAYRVYAKKCIQEGKSVGTFYSEYLSPSLLGALAGSLEVATSMADVDIIFSDAMKALDWKGYP